MRRGPAGLEETVVRLTERGDSTEEGVAHIGIYAAQGLRGKRLNHGEAVLHPVGHLLHQQLLLLLGSLAGRHIDRRSGKPIRLAGRILHHPPFAFDPAYRFTGDGEPKLDEEVRAMLENFAYAGT